jgi:hypothetical protein
MRQYAKVFCPMLTVSLVAGVAVAGPFEDAEAAYDRFDL